MSASPPTSCFSTRLCSCRFTGLLGVGQVTAESMDTGARQGGADFLTIESEYPDRNTLINQVFKWKAT